MHNVGVWVGNKFMSKVIAGYYEGLECDLQNCIPHPNGVNKCINAAVEYLLRKERGIMEIIEKTKKQKQGKGA